MNRNKMMLNMFLTNFWRKLSESNLINYIMDFYIFIGNR
jgi:hypothetical protein